MKATAQTKAATSTKAAARKKATVQTNLPQEQKPPPGQRSPPEQRPLLKQRPLSKQRPLAFIAALPSKCLPALCSGGGFKSGRSLFWAVAFDLLAAFNWMAAFFSASGVFCSGNTSLCLDGGFIPAALKSNSF